jgi:hypothetical protein
VNPVNGQQYTLDFRVTMTGANQLTVSNALYAGLGTTGSQLYGIGGVSNNVLDTAFNALAFGIADKDSSIGMTQDVSLVEITTDVVPEPSTWLLLVSGLGLLIGLVSRRRS